ncbi:hypothetical protein LguiB_014064 [Lonicera macranthoides]
MDSRLYSAATTCTNLDLFTQFKDKLGHARTGSKNTVLHLACQFGHLEAVKRILSLNQQLLLQHNEKGEFALHLAARGGHLSIVRELIHRTKEMPHGCAARGGYLSIVRELIHRIKEWPHGFGDIEKGFPDGKEWAKNKIMKSETYHNGYTPLHEAVQSRHIDIVKMLIEEDPEYLYTPIPKTWMERLENPLYLFAKRRTERQETPLYLAARRGFDELVKVILQNCKSPTYIGPHGKTALHGAVISNNKKCAELLLNWRADLVGQKDCNYQTPLHFVAHLGYADLVSSLLLSDKSIAYLKDHMGNKAIHIAASRGHVLVLKEIMYRCPDSWDMTGFRSQNILHMAVENQQKNVIEYILEECPIIDALINQKNRFGNTPLHLLSMSSYSMPQLILHHMADKGVSNNKKMTALDLVTNNVGMSETTKNEIIVELKNAGATVGKPYQRPSEKEMDEDKKKRIGEMTQTHILVATLIATITFTAGFTMPGGFIQSGSPHQGMAVLTKSIAFRAFIISDTIAFVLSTLAIFLYFFAVFYRKSSRHILLTEAASVLIYYALLTMMVAFVMGIYAVLANSLSLAIATCLAAFSPKLHTLLSIWTEMNMCFARGHRTEHAE